jgi:uncharacterized membrane protein
MANLYEPSGKQRIQSIDIVRGVIMLIMALDHTRDFFHIAGMRSDPTDMATTTPILFFTRWITHYCAPNFVFLSGISAYLAGTRRTKSELSGFLIKRGLWLILVEVVLLSLAFSANPLYNVIILQVLWAIGVSMVLLGLLVRLPVKVIALIGLLIFFGHDLLDYVTMPKEGTTARILDNLFFVAQGSIIQLNKTHFIFDLYAVVPWTGVMLVGYSFGSIFTKTFDPERRKKILRYTGIAAVALLIVLRLINKYGDPNPWSVQRSGMYTLLSFLNVSKYPPSLLYLFITIGPALIILSFTENVQNKVTAVFTTYGNVPFLYYIMHFYLLRFIGILLFFVEGFTSSQIINRDSGSLFQPKGFGVNLLGVYIIWLLVISMLYFPCRWFAKYKKTHNQWWLSYL